MSDLKQQLIRLGRQRPDLREHLRPVLDHIKQASMSLEEAAAIAVVNAEMIPDPTNRGATDAWLVPLYDMVALKEALNRETGRNVRLSRKKAARMDFEARDGGVHFTVDGPMNDGHDWRDPLPDRPEW